MPTNNITNDQLKWVLKSFYDDQTISYEDKKKVSDLVWNWKINDRNWLWIVSWVYSTLKKTSPIQNTGSTTTPTVDSPIITTPDNWLQDIINKASEENNKKIATQSLNQIEKQDSKPTAVEWWANYFQDIFWKNWATSAIDTGADIIDKWIKWAANQATEWAKNIWEWIAQMNIASPELTQWLWKTVFGNPLQKAEWIKSIYQWATNLTPQAKQDLAGWALKVAEWTLWAGSAVLAPGATIIGNTVLGWIGRTDIGKQALQWISDIQQKAWNIINKLPVLSNYRDTLWTEEEKQRFDNIVWNLPAALISWLGKKAVDKYAIDTIDKAIGWKISWKQAELSWIRQDLLNEKIYDRTWKILQPSVWMLSKNELQVFWEDILKWEQWLISSAKEFGKSKDFKELSWKVDNKLWELQKQKEFLVNKADQWSTLLGWQAYINVANTLLKDLKQLSTTSGWLDSKRQAVYNKVKQYSDKLNSWLKVLKPSEALELKAIMEDEVSFKWQTYSDAELQTASLKRWKLADMRNDMYQNLPAELSSINKTQSELINTKNLLEVQLNKLKNFRNTTMEAGALQKVVGSVIQTADTLTWKASSQLLKWALGPLIWASQTTRIWPNEVNQILSKLTGELSSLTKWEWVWFFTGQYNKTKNLISWTNSTVKLQTVQNQQQEKARLEQEAIKQKQARAKKLIELKKQAEGKK